MGGNVIVVKLQGTNGLIDAVRSNEPLDRVYLAEGDSWFDFPTFQHFPSHVNLLTALRTDKLRTLVLSIAHIGDKLEDMVDDAQFDIYARLLRKRYGMLYSGILFSGGGNDLLAHVGDMVIRPRAAKYTVDDCCATGAENDFFDRTEGYLRRLLDERADTPNAETPVFMHAYAFPTPRPVPTFIGPFLKLNKKGFFFRRFENIGIHDPDIQKGITTRWLKRWKTVLDTVAKDYPTFHVIDSCNCLDPAQPDWLEPRGDWYDEIHPRPDGFAKVADLYRKPLAKFSREFDLLL